MAQQMVFKARKTSHLTDKKAQRYGEFLAGLDEQNGGEGVTPHMFIEASEPEDSPGHDNFEWDDNKAAYNYRKYQARATMGAILVTVVGADEKPRPERYLHQVRYAIEHPDGEGEESEPVTGSVYATISKIAQTPEYRSQIVTKAKKELDYWRKKYQQYQELDEQVHVVSGILDGWSVEAA